jgi:hypothetical protein
MGTQSAAMTRTLKRAFAEATKLSKREQNELARWLLAELSCEERWDQISSSSSDHISELGLQALDEHRKGRTWPLDPDKM